LSKAITPSDPCKVCNQAPETLVHLIFLCDMTHQSWGSHWHGQCALPMSELWKLSRPLQVPKSTTTRSYSFAAGNTADNRLQGRSNRRWQDSSQHERRMRSSGNTSCKLPHKRNVFQRCFVWCNTLGLFVYPSAYISSSGQQTPQLISQLI